MGGVGVNVVDERLKLDGFDAFAEPLDESAAFGRKAVKRPSLETGAGQECVTIGHACFLDGCVWRKV